jgi:GT2 family glycosyltransferase
MQKSSVGILVLTWNDWKNTVACLESIFKTNYNNFDVFLIDNNSNYENLNNIIQWCKKKNIPINEVSKNARIKKIGKKKFYLIKLKEVSRKYRFAVNIGATAAYNRGFRFVLRNNYDFAIKIDCDFIVTTNFIKGMVDTLNLNNNYAAVSPKVFYWIKKKTKIIWWMRFILTRNYVRFHRTGLDRRMVDSSKFKGIILTDAICGACVMYRTNILRKIGLPDEDFFFGPEDVEISQRMRKYGNLLVVNLDYHVYHKVSQSAYVSGMKARIYFETLGWLFLIKKLCNSKDKFLGYLFFFLRLLLRLLRIVYKKDKDPHIGFVLGVKDFFLKKL